MALFRLPIIFWFLHKRNSKVKSKGQDEKNNSLIFFNTDSLSPRYSKRLGEKCFVSRICQIKLDIAAAGVGAIANRILLAR